MSLKKIVSGGQTGADRAGLDAAICVGIEHGGWCPKYRRSEDGAVPRCYKLAETTSWKYPERTLKNISESDGTVIFFSGDKLSGGSRLTVNNCRWLKKPFLLLPLGRLDHAGEQFAAFVETNDISVLNVAGSRESVCPGIHDKVLSFLCRVLVSL